MNGTTATDRTTPARRSVRRRPTAVFLVMVSASWAVVGGCRPSGDVDPPSEYLAAAIEAGRWLQSVTDSTGVAPLEFPGDAASGSLGSGSAGRAVFFAELYATTGDSSFRRSAIDAAGDALRRVPPENFGLYGGSSGIAFAATAVGRTVGEPDLVAAARDVFDRIARSVQSDETIADGVNDVLAGLAGIGLGLLYAADAHGDPSYREAAVTIADRLLAAADTSPPSGTRWLRGSEHPFDLPNFSHGTAGVGYFFARMAAASGAARFSGAARQAADYVEAIAIRDSGMFLVPYGVPNDGYSTRFDIGWAHGPAGTARLHYALWRQDGDGHDAGVVDAQARALLASGIPGPSSDPDLWADPLATDRRFGSSGAAVFLADWGRIRSDEDASRLSRRVGDDLLRRSVVESGGRYWPVARYGFQAGTGDAVWTGYFYGASGFGLTLLHLHAADTAAPPRIRFPDDPFPSG